MTHQIEFSLDNNYEYKLQTSLGYWPPEEDRWTDLPPSFAARGQMSINSAPRPHETWRV